MSKVESRDKSFKVIRLEKGEEFKIVMRILDRQHQNL